MNSQTLGSLSLEAEALYSECPGQAKHPPGEEGKRGSCGGPASSRECSVQGGSHTGAVFHNEETDRYT